MKRTDYKLYTWYPLTEEEYWVDFGDYPDFENCQTLVINESQEPWKRTHIIITYEHCIPGWSSMAKQGTWKFMIVEKPKME